MQFINRLLILRLVLTFDQRNWSQLIR